MERSATEGGCAANEKPGWKAASTVCAATTRPSAATRQRPSIGKFGDADERSAKAEGIGDGGDQKSQSQRNHGPSRQGREENIVTVAPQCFGEP